MDHDIEQAADKAAGGPVPAEATAKGLKTMTAEVAEFVEAKGWNATPVSFGDAMALLHSEVSEALEAYRDHRMADATTDSGKPEGVGSEFADVLIRLLDDCHRFGIDLEFEYERKMAYNLTRPYQHGGRTLAGNGEAGT